MDKKNIHVIPHLTQWAIKIEGENKIISAHKTQSSAIDEGRKLAKKYMSELIIHTAEGKIRDKDSYGNDPCPPKDTKF
ncbi:MAG: DUF2188 domain-containing protein [Candidatus Moranbacteria bacterium]|nr:DUF2188 domain-containing protein [Candidatus Moranbacteria bacterium]